MHKVIACASFDRVDFIVAEKAVIEVCPDHVFNINKVDTVDWLSAGCRRCIKDCAVLAWSINAAIGLVCTGCFNIKINNNALLKTREVSRVAAFAAVKLVCAIRDEGIVAKSADQRICAKAADKDVIAVSAVQNIVAVITCQIVII